MCDDFAQGLHDDRDLSGRSSRPTRWCSRMKRSCESNSAARIRVGLQQNYFIFETGAARILGLRKSTASSTRCRGVKICGVVRH